MKNCKNCGAELEEGAGYCSYCGARVLGDKITLRFILDEILDKVLSVDNKILKTFLHLFYKPHKVIEDYIRGVRKRYFNPFSYLLVSLTLAGISTLITRKFTMDALSSTANPAVTDANAAVTKQMMEFIFDYQSFVTVGSLPFYAFVSWIVFMNKKRFNYLEHNIIYIYTSAQLAVVNFLVVGIAYLLNITLFIELSVVLTALFLVYNCFVLIMLFKLTFLQFIVKTLYFLVVGGGVYLIVSMTIGIIMAFVLGPEFFKQFAPQNLKKDSIQKVQPIDSLNIEKKDSVPDKDPKTISFYEAKSRLNCLS